MFFSCVRRLIACLLSLAPLALVIVGCEPEVAPGPGHSPAEAASSAPVPSAAEGAVEDPPLIILISFDTLRADHLGSYGYKRFTSPVLDILASEGVLFEDASATASWTLPSHASMLTGLYPMRHGVLRTNTRLSDEIDTLAEMLFRAGYDTAAVVNMTFLNQQPFGVTRGFQRFELIPADAARRGPATSVTDQAIDWLSELSDRPTFLFIHYYDLHTNYGALPSFEKLFVGPYEGSADGTGWQSFLANISDEFVEECRRDFDPKRCDKAKGRPERMIGTSASRIHFDSADIQHLIDLYDAGIRQLDTELDRLFSFLREQQLLDRTYLIFTSDHGEEFGDHGSVDHSYTQYQEVIGIPLVIRGPGIPAGMRISTPVSTVDLVPTVLALAGVAAPEGSHALDGLDLAGLWRDPTGSHGAAARKPFLERNVYSEAHFPRGPETRIPPKASVRRHDYKFHYTLEDGSYELYDLATDPSEKHDIANSNAALSHEFLTLMKERHDQAASTSEKIELADDVREQLKALGYMD